MLHTVVPTDELQRPLGDAMNVAGKNAQMHEDLMAGGDDTMHVNGIIARMREAGCSESTLELMRTPQPLP